MKYHHSYNKLKQIITVGILLAAYTFNGWITRGKLILFSVISHKLFHIKLSQLINFIYLYYNYKS